MTPSEIHCKDGGHHIHETVVFMRQLSGYVGLYTCTVFTVDTN